MIGIKTVILKKYDYVLKDMNSEEFELKGRIYSRTEYDEEGRTVAEIRYDENGDIEEHYAYEYNEKGVRTAEKSFDESGELIDHMEYKVDPDGKILLAWKHYADGSKDTFSYRYDKEGNLVEKEVSTDEDELEQRERFGYENGKQVLHETWGEDNELTYRKETIYDGQGNVKQELRWNAENDSTTKTINEYDDEGELISVSAFDQDSDLLFKVVYERDKDKNITLIREESADRNVHTLIDYDDKGNAVVQVEKDVNGVINSRIERTYDENGRVIETEALIDRHGMGMNQHYILRYEYELY